MQRRSFVAAVGFGALSVAGCVAPGDGTRRATDDTPATPFDGDASVPPLDAPFPPNRDDVDEVRWYRQTSNPDGGLVLEPSTGTASLPGADLSFTLRNGTDREFRTNFYGWGLYRWEDGRWHYVAPRSVPQPLTPLAAGATHRWTLRVDNDDLSPASVWIQGTSDLGMSALGGGTYAFAIDGWWPDQTATPTYEHQTMRAALFALDGDPLPLEPSRAVTDVRRDEDVVVVSATYPAAAEIEGERPVTYVLARDDSATDPRRLVTEQVYRRWPLRDALAHAGPDVTEVRVETTTTGRPPFGLDQDERRSVAYDGRTYGVRSVEGHE